MANKKQNKHEYVKPRSLSLSDSDYSLFFSHAKSMGFSFTQLIRMLFHEDIIAEQSSDPETMAFRNELKLKRDGEKKKRLKAIYMK